LGVERKESGEHIEGVHEYRQGRWYDEETHEDMEVLGISVLATSVLFRVKQYVPVEQPAH